MTSAPPNSSRGPRISDLESEIPSLQTSTLPNWRARLLVGGLTLFWAALAVRLVDLQWARRQTLAEKASRQRSFLETIPARPGEIVDRNGRLLATSVSVRSLYVVPSRVSNPWQTAWSLADALGLDADRL